MAIDTIKVLDIGANITGPIASGMLGDLGADVIKIERPKVGDPFRAFSSGLYSPFFCAINWNKRSLTLDLQKPEGIDIYMRLAAEADVIVENFRPGVARKLGIGHEAMATLNPRLVYCSITGFGDTGPYSARPSYDMVSQAVSGYLSLLMDADECWSPNPAIGDQVTGMYAAFGILGALVERQTSGKGRHVEISMLDSMVNLSASQFSIAAHINQLPVREARAAYSTAFVLPCSDNRAMVIHLSAPPAFWDSLVHAIERPDLARDERFATRAGRIENYLELKAELRKTFRLKSRDEWQRILEENDVPSAPMYSLDEVRADPQVKHLDLFGEYEHPTEGDVLRVRGPVFMDGKRDETLRLPPALGEHNHEILTAIGLSDDDILALSTKEII